MVSEPIRKFVLYLPHGSFGDVNQFKDQGVLLDIFSKRGFNSILVANKIEIQKQKKQFEPIELRNGGVGLTNRLLEIIEVFVLLAKIKPDIILAWSSPNSAALRILTIFLRSKIVWIMKMDSDGEFFHRARGISKIVNRIYLGMSSLLYNTIITESSCGYEILSKYMINTKKLKVIPNAMNDEIFSINDIGRVKEKVGRLPIIITSSNIIRSRGLEVLIRAFSIASCANENWTLVIAGRIVDEEYYEELHKLISEYRLGNRVKFLGLLEHSDFISYLNRCSIYVSSTFEESFGLARLEAVVSGLVVISTPAGCAKSIPGIIVFNFGDYERLSQLLIEFISDENRRIEAIRVSSKYVPVSYDQVFNDIIREIGFEEYLT